MYDVIVVGARVAGAPTAMLLARTGYRVLLVDRASFPSDTMSTHQIQIPGSVMLKRWGLLDRVLATNPGAASQVRFDMGDVVMNGHYPTREGIGAIHSPRRFVLDNILVEAAIEAGVTLRQEFITEALEWEDGRVVGIRGRQKAGSKVTERATMVIGADGKHSLVAKQVEAPVYDAHPALTCGYYSYWEGVPLSGGEMYRRGNRTIGVWPTNQNTTLIYTAWPISEFDRFRADVEGNYMATIDLVPELSERVRQGRRAERVVGTADLPNFYRKPVGNGWALVGDAGMSVDPITGYGINNAFQDADLLARTLDDGLAGRARMADALSAYEQRRNALSKPGYDFTLDTARMTPFAPEQVALMNALAQRPQATEEFYGVLTGLTDPAEFFAPKHLFQLVGFRSMMSVMMSKMFKSPRRRAG